MRFAAYVAIGLCAFLSGCDSSQTDVPKIQFDAEALQLGAILDDSTHSVVFTYRNTGSTDLRITSVKPGCGCGKVVSYDSRVLPGDIGRLAIEYRDRKQGTSLYQVTRKVLMATNDPVRPVVELVFTADIHRPLELIPSTSISVGDIEIGANPTGRAKLQYFAPLGEGKFSVVDEVTGEALDVDFKPSRDRFFSQLHEYDVTIAFPKPQAFGMYSGEATVRNSAAASASTSMRVNGYVRGPLEIKPTMINWGMVDGSVLDQVIRLSMDKPHESAELHVTRQPDFVSVDLSAVSPAVWQIRVSLKSDVAINSLTNQTLSGDILLSCDTLEFPVRIPVKAYLVPAKLGHTTTEEVEETKADDSS